MKTDYVGRIQAVSRIYTSGDPTTNRTRRRILDIQNLGGDTITLTLWHEMAVNFNLQEYESMEKPVVIAVRSCWVRRFNGLQLSGTSATHYYLNPNIPETFRIKQMYQQQAEVQPILNIDPHRHENDEEEKYRNHFPLVTLLEALDTSSNFISMVEVPQGDGDFVLDKVFKPNVLPLPAPPPQPSTVAYPQPSPPLPIAEEEP
ncbi:DNA helicase [Tanacetum coccineum]